MWISFTITLWIQCWYCAVSEDQTTTNSLQTVVIGSQQNNCLVEFQLELSEKPERQHKAPPKSSHHQQAPVLTVGVYQWVELHCTCCCSPQQRDQVKRTAARAVTLQLQQSNNLTTPYEEPSEAPGILQYQIVSTNGHVVVPTERRRLNLNTRGHVTLKKEKTITCDDAAQCIELYSTIICDEDLGISDQSNGSVGAHGFYLYADNLGYSDIKVALVWVSIPPKEHTDFETEEDGGEMKDGTHVENVSSTKEHVHGPLSKPKPIRWFITDARIFVPEYHYTQDRQAQQMLPGAMILTNDTTQSRLGRWENKIHVTVLLRPQKFYLAADWSAAIIAFMIAVSVGCCNDPVLMRAYWHKPMPIIVGLVCQLVAGPLIALGIGSLFNLNLNQAFGLFVLATVPGGGLAYLFTYLVHGERHLTAALSLTTSLLITITSPLWTFSVGWFWFNRPIHIGKSVGWLSLIAFGQAFGTIMRGCRPSVAYGILTWITRPLLLLAGILMVTLGVYINHYAFAELNQNLILSLLLLITCGFILGWVAGHITGQEIAINRALATEASVFNGLLCVPLLRTSVHAPEGDLAAIVAVYATFFVPIPLVYHGIVSVIHHWLTDYCQRRKKQAEQNSLSAIVANASGNGTDLRDIGATSVAAVAAAAIAVAPAIASGPKDIRNRAQNTRSHGLNTTETHQPGPVEFLNTSEPSLHFPTNSVEAEQAMSTQLGHTIHTGIHGQHSPVTAQQIENDVVKHNPGRQGHYHDSRNQSKPRKSQVYLGRTRHSDEQVLPYLLSDYDPRSIGKQMAQVQHQKRGGNETGHTHPLMRPCTTEKQKPPPYTNL